MFMKLSYSFLPLLQVCQNVTELAAAVVPCIACNPPATATIFLNDWSISQIISKKPVCWIWWWTLKLQTHLRTNSHTKQSLQRIQLQTEY